MLTHRHEPRNPARVFLLGASGFIGRALVALLEREQIPFIAPRSNELNLTGPEAQSQLRQLLRPEDSLVVLSALTPDRGRGIDTFSANLRMVEQLCAVLAEIKPAHVIYFSSDAVYPFGAGPVSEASLAAPTDLYGAMHRSRELMLAQTLGNALCILRPSLVYGAGDSHNSYGPNRFRRQAAKDGKIPLGGEGEETRDHVFVDDVAALSLRVLRQGSTGLLNIATGRSIDFGSLARMVAARFKNDVNICPSPRTAPATHRHFDTTALLQAFPDFAFTPLERGLDAAMGDL